MAIFDVSPTAVLGDRLLLTANVSSENNTPRTSKTTFQLELPVKYAVYTVISRCHTTTSKGSSPVTLWGPGNPQSLQQLATCHI
nr:integrin alpha-X-like [Vicugna pacos]